MRRQFLFLLIGLLSVLILFIGMLGSVAVTGAADAKPTAPVMVEMHPVFTYKPDRLLQSAVDGANFE